MPKRSRRSIDGIRSTGPSRGLGTRHLMENRGISKSIEGVRSGLADGR